MTGPGQARPAGSGRAPSYRAVVFDMDGVLTDSEPAFFEAISLVLAEDGASIAYERYRRFLGTSTRHTWTGLMELLDLKGRYEDYVARYEDVLIDCLARPRPPLAGAVDLIDALDARDVPYALATSSRRSWADAVLGSAGLAGRLPLRVTADDVTNAKPAPDTYRLAAERLGVPPAACIAVEDSPSGLASAKGAGMYAVQSRGASTAFPPIDGADLVITSLADFPLALLP